MERTTLKLDPLRFAVGEKCHSVLVHERHVPQIEHQLLPKLRRPREVTHLCFAKLTHVFQIASGRQA